MQTIDKDEQSLAEVFCLVLGGELLYQMVNFLFLRMMLMLSKIKETGSGRSFLALSCCCQILLFGLNCVGDENGICPVFASFFQYTLFFRMIFNHQLSPATLS